VVTIICALSAISCWLQLLPCYGWLSRQHESTSYKHYIIVVFVLAREEWIIDYLLLVEWTLQVNTTNVITCSVIIIIIMRTRCFSSR
jgi:hypothetical protein